MFGFTYSDYLLPVLNSSCYLGPVLNSSGYLLPVDFLKDFENLDEEVDNVEVELDGCHDVLLRAHTGHDHLEQIQW